MLLLLDSLLQETPALGSGRCPDTGWVSVRTTTMRTTTILNLPGPTQENPSRRLLRGSTCLTGMQVALVETWPLTLEDSKVWPAWQAFLLMKLNLNWISRWGQGEDQEVEMKMKQEQLVAVVALQVGNSWGGGTAQALTPAGGSSGTPSRQ